MTLLATAMLVFCRVGGLMLGLPMVSAHGVPRWVAVFGSLAITMLIVPHAPTTALPETLPALMFAGVSELGFGFLFAAIIRLLFSTIAIAGEVMSLQTGMAMAVTFDPLQKTQEPILATFVTWLAGLVFIWSGLHLRAIEILAQSFHDNPVGTLVMPTAGLQAYIDATGVAFMTGIQFAGPVLALLFLINAFMALVIKLAPRMNVFFAIGMTGGNVLGLVVIIVSIPWLLMLHQHLMESAVSIAGQSMGGT